MGEWKNVMIFLGVLLMAILLIYIYFSPNQSPTITGEVISEYEEIEEIEIIDSFSNINELHFGHMPITYSFEDGLDKEEKQRQINLTRLAFQKIQEETDNFVRFEEVNEDSDISIYFEEPKEFSIAEAIYYVYKDDSNLIERGELFFYGQGQVCKSGYPDTEVHEILHILGFEHNPNFYSIMYGYATSTSWRCKTTEIDKIYIDCLKNIYSDGEIKGDCSKTQDLIRIKEGYEDTSLLYCEDGSYEVEGSDYCCPEPNMIIVDGYCEYK